MQKGSKCANLKRTQRFGVYSQHFGHFLLSGMPKNNVINVHEVLVQNAIFEGPATHYSIGGNTEISHFWGGLNTKDMPI